MKNGFNFKAYKKWVENIGIAEKDFNIFLKKFLLEMAQRTVRLGKPRTPVDTGFLRNSWYIGNQKIEQREQEAINQETGHHLAAIDPEKSDILSIANVGNILYVEIGLYADYASAVEYGHGSYMGRYMLAIAVDQIQKQIPARFDKQFKEFIRNHGV